MIGRAGRFLTCLLTAASGYHLSIAARVQGERAVERARYRFVIGATQPFDQAYPRSVFEKKVEREIAEERVLRKLFGMTVTRRILDREFDRIEKATKAPDQWAVIEKALGNDRMKIEEVFCRPLVVDRALHAKFAFDQKIHAVPHQRAREARAAFLAGRTPAGESVVLLSRRTHPDATETIVARAQKDAAVPRVVEPVRKQDRVAPVPVEPELAVVVGKELAKPGDVTTILEERDRFEVFRLIEQTEDAWEVEAVTFPKVDFDTWFEKVRRSS